MGYGFGKPKFHTQTQHVGASHGDDGNAGSVDRKGTTTRDASASDDVFEACAEPDFYQNLIHWKTDTTKHNPSASTTTQGGSRTAPTKGGYDRRRK